MVTYLNLGLAAFVDHVEGKVLHVGLDRGIVKSSADQSLGIKDGVGGVHGHLVLGGITNQSFGVGEGHKRWGGSVTLVVGDDLDLAMLEHTDARIGGAQINTDSGSLGHFAILKSKQKTTNFVLCGRPQNNLLDRDDRLHETSNGQ